MGGIPPGFGTLFGPKKSIRAEENLFARDSAGDFSATAADNPDEVAGAAMDFASPATVWYRRHLTWVSWLVRGIGLAQAWLGPKR
jgi:hypothetical protein